MKYAITIVEDDRTNDVLNTRVQIKEFKNDKEAHGFAERKMKRIRKSKRLPISKEAVAYDGLTNPSWCCKVLKNDTFFMNFTFDDFFYDNTDGAIAMTIQKVK